jgi:hypothetical protein
MYTCMTNSLLWPIWHLEKIKSLMEFYFKTATYCFWFLKLDAVYSFFFSLCKLAVHSCKKNCRFLLSLFATSEYVCLTEFLNVTTQKFLNSFLCNFTLRSSTEILQRILIIVQNLTVVLDKINEITSQALLSTFTV